jgi:thiol-disulfide isomerase/thioredoxin
MRKLLVALALIGLTAVTGRADDPKPAKTDPSKGKPDGKLAVGDPAPKLEATKWLQGEPVKAFAPGKVYVVEFWATWCGPCIVMMPHMGALQAEYKEKGVTFVGFSAHDANNTEEKVAALVKKRGPKLKYTFAYADNSDTKDAYMKASGQRGIPCSFVVDGAGKIAYIGHPMYLDVVLPKVLDGSIKTEKVKEQLAAVQKEVNGLFGKLGNPDAEAALKALSDFEKANPLLAHIPYFVGPKLNLLIKAGKVAEARKDAEGVIKRAVKQDDSMALFTVSNALRSAKGDKESQALALKAAKDMLKVAGEKDALALYNLAESYFATGDRTKAAEEMTKAIAAADNPGMKGYFENRLKAYDATKEGKK